MAAGMTRLAVALCLLLGGCILSPEYRDSQQGCMVYNGCQNRR